MFLVFLMNLENGYDFDSEEKRENWELCLCDVARCEWNLSLCIDELAFI